MEGVMELTTGRERRRRWSLADKLRIVAESHEPGALIRAVAARHGVCESLVFTWRRQVRDGVLAAPEMPVFMPVQMLETPRPTAATQSSPSSVPVPSARPSSGLIEIELGNGHQVRVGSDVNLAALRRVLAALRG
jgi:transposase